MWSKNKGIHWVIMKGTHGKGWVYIKSKGVHEKIRPIWIRGKIQLISWINQVSSDSVRNRSF